MSLLEKASIVTTPTAYGVGVLNSIKPAQSFSEELVTNGNFATDSDWTKVQSTISNGEATITSPDGSYAAIYQNFLTVGKVYTYNITVSSVTNGVSIFSGSSLNTLITSAGNYQGTFVATNVRLEVKRNNDDIMSATISNVSVKEQIDADFDFTRSTTATRVNERSLIETVAANIPRIDFTGGTGSILLEPSRTNLFEYDIDFSQSVWTKGNVTLQSNTAISPEGLQNASNIYPTTNVAYIYNTTTASSSVYTVSAYVKANGKNVAWLYSNSGSTNGTIYFDLSDDSMQVVAGSGGTPTGTINKMPNGWYRITYTTGTAISLTGGSGVGVSDAKGSLNATQNGTDGILVYGLQIEAGSYPTSLIHTSGSAVTRAAETLNNAANSDLINSTEGVLYAEMAALANDSTNRNITLSDSTDTNRIVLKYDNQSNVIQSFNRVGGVETAFLGATVSDITQFSKIAIKFKENDYALWIDGVEVDTDNSSTTFPANTLNDLSLPDLYARVKCLAVFKEALSDTELACLTSTNNREIFLNYYYRMQYVGANTEALSCAEQTFNI